MILTVEESQEMIRQKAIDIATTILIGLGVEFCAASNLQQVDTIEFQQVKRFLAEGDLKGASASVMQMYLLRIEDNRLEAQMISLAKLLNNMGDDLYYDHGNAREALICYQLAVGLDPNNQEALNTAVAVCTPQGDVSMIDVALPYAIVLRHLNPKRDSVEYVLQLMEEQKGKRDVN